MWFSLGTLQHHLHLEIHAPFLTTVEFLIFGFLSVDKGFSKRLCLSSLRVPFFDLLTCRNQREAAAAWHSNTAEQGFPSSSPSSLCQVLLPSLLTCLGADSKSRYLTLELPEQRKLQEVSEHELFSVINSCGIPMLTQLHGVIMLLFHELGNSSI